MATKEELLQKNEDELVELARERNVEVRSGMSRDELAEALADGGSEGDSEFVKEQKAAGEPGSLRRNLGPISLDEESVKEQEQRDEVREAREDKLEAVQDALHDPDQVEGSRERQEAKIEEADPDIDVQAEADLSHHSVASDPEVVGDHLTGQDAESLEEMGQDSVAATEADLSRASVGPNVLQSPSERAMTGAVNEGHAKEQEAILKDLPDDYVGDVSESGDFASGVDRRGSRKDNLAEGDDRELYEVRQEDVIDFPPPLGERDRFQARSDAQRRRSGAHDDTEDRAYQEPSSGTPFATSPVIGSSDRAFSQKGVFYTDGISGTADHNLERSYEIPEVLQSSNPEARRAGDESLSEAALEEQSDADRKRADSVKTRDEENNDNDNE